MRLTLRTLLAYLDDTLQPEQAREIGQKIAESQAAQDLITRIRKVTRRRRIMTPPTSGPEAKLDANTIAEYLDSELPSDEVARVEEAALESDAYLAEIAACHQILTLVMGEPALIPPTARERMYNLLPGKKPARSRTASTKPVGRGSLDGKATAVDDEEDTLLLGLPLVGRGAWLTWALPLAAVFLLLGAGVALWMAFSTTPTPIVARAPLPEDKQARHDIQAESTTKLTEPATKSNGAESAEAKAPETKAAVEKSAPVETKSMAEAPKTTTTPTSPAENTVKNEAPAAAAAPAIPPRDQPPGTAQRELGKAVLNDSPPPILLQRPVGQPNWQRVRPESKVGSQETLVSLPGYRSDIRLDNGVQLLLWGSLPEFGQRVPLMESMVTLYSTPPLDLDLKLDRGRVLIANRKRTGAALVRLRFANQAWDLILHEPGSEIAAEFLGICQPLGPDPKANEPALLLRMVMLKGEANVKAGIEEHLLRPGSLFNWDSERGNARVPRDSAILPEWYTTRTPPQSPAVNEMMRALESFSSRLTRDLSVVLGEAMLDPERANRIMAVRTSGAIDDWAKLVDGLSNQRYRDVREASAFELRHLLGLSMANDAALIKVLVQKDYTENQARTVLQLLHGFDQDPKVGPAVVDFLNHEKLAVRQLTHSLLVSMHRDAMISYDPAGDTRQREDGYERWRQYLNRAKIR